jgi:hypothetical protein
MIVFVVIGLIAALLNTLLIDELVGSAIAYGIAGVLCGLVLRTRLEGGVGRMLVVCFFGIGFAAGGVWSMLTAIAFFGSLVDGASIGALSWGLIGFAATTPYLGTRFVCLAAGVFDQICGSIGLESPERELARLRVRLEFRLR